MRKKNQFPKQRWLSRADVAAGSLLGFVNNGHDVEELIGCLVKTYEGQRLGRLLDLKFNLFNWNVAELRLANQSTLRIHADEITVKGNEIIVPASYADQLVFDDNVVSPSWARVGGIRSDLSLAS